MDWYESVGETGWSASAYGSGATAASLLLQRPQKYCLAEPQWTPRRGQGPRAKAKAKARQGKARANVRKLLPCMLTVVAARD